MTIERARWDAPIVFQCDGECCAKSIESHRADFTGAFDEVKSLGWRERKVAGLAARQHFCPDCRP